MTTADKAAGAIREALAALDAPNSPGVYAVILNRTLPAAASPAALVAILDEMDRLRKDAQRYQRLRDPGRDTYSHRFRVMRAIPQGPCAPDWKDLQVAKLDEAIDDALKENRA
jgi:hypothetical protein